MPSPPTSSRPPRAKGFALISVLMVIVMMTVLITGLFTLARLELNTSQSFSDRYRAELALNAGFEHAKALLQESIGPQLDQRYHVVLKPAGEEVGDGKGVGGGSRDEVDNLVAAIWDEDTALWNYKPLFSSAVGTANPTPTLQRPIWPFFRPARAAVPFIIIVDKTTKIPAVKLYPTVYPFQAAFPPNFTPDVLQYVNGVADPVLDPYGPRVEWLILHDDDGKAAGRYSFWLEDIEANLDPKIAESAPRELHEDLVPGYDLEEAALYTLFDPEAEEAAGSREPPADLHQMLTENRDFIFTWETLKQEPFGLGKERSLPGDPETFLAVGAESYAETPVVPGGMGYANAGTVVPDLNQFVSDQDVDGLAEWIEACLPNFAGRRNPAFADTGENYYKTLAANIIDYADGNSDPLIAAGSHRGIENYPVTSSIFYEVAFVAFDRPGDGRVYVIVDVNLWVELWNMTNQPVEGVYRPNYEPEYIMPVGFIPVDFGDYRDPPAEVEVTGLNGQHEFDPVPVAMAPNEYLVLKFPVRYRINAGPDSVFVPSSATLEGGTDGGTEFEGRWNTARVHASPGGVERRATLSFTLTASGERGHAWQGWFPGGNYGDIERNRYENNVGDPMAAYYLQGVMQRISYERGASWWGRNLRSNISPTRIYSGTHARLWPDGGHDTVATGLTPKRKNVDPFDLEGSRPATEPQFAPLRISNLGRYHSLTELGHVYDPLLWDAMLGRTEFDDIRDRLRDWGGTGTTPAANSVFGGGNTLRIGRAEHALFNAPGARASQLLDLFYLLDENPDPFAPSNVRVEGRVNLNTAPRDVIRSLVVGKLLTDPESRPEEIESPTEKNDSLRLGDRVAAAIVAHRPFASLSEVPQVTLLTADSPARGQKVFGNHEIYLEDGEMLGDGDAGKKTAAGNPGDLDEGIEWTDAAAEELFARLFHNTGVRSRNFRLFVTGQAVRESRSGGFRELGSVSKIYQVFVPPNGKVEVTYEREL